MDGVSHLVMRDPRIQRLMSNPILDLVHKQVVMALYSMDADDHLHECKQLLPLYLSMEWKRCEAILQTLAQAGLIAMDGAEIKLTHRITLPHNDALCGCRA